MPYYGRHTNRRLRFRRWIETVRASLADISKQCSLWWRRYSAWMKQSAEAASTDEQLSALNEVNVYVEKLRAKGYSVEKIRERLREAGWNDVQIDIVVAVTTDREPQAPSPPTQEIPASQQRLTLDTSQWIGLAGAMVLAFGVFAPIVSAPIIGSLNYFRDGSGDGIFVVIFAIVTVILVFRKQYRMLWITGIGSLAVLAFTFINFQVRMAQARSHMERELAGNPFKGLAEIGLQSIQLEWGWMLLIVGAALVIAAAGYNEVRQFPSP